MTQALSQPAEPIEPVESAEPPQQTGGSLSRRAIKASVLTLFQNFSLQGLRFASNIILAALLSPSIFGVMAVINSIKGILTRCSDLGIAPAVIQHKGGDDPEFLDTAWTMKLVRGAILTAIVALLAYPLAFWIPKEPEPMLLWVAPVAGLMSLVKGLQTTKTIQLERKMDLKQLVKYDIGCNLFGTFLTLALAWWTRSVWALVLGGLCAAMLHVVLSHITLPGHNNRLRYNKQHAKEIWGFGKWVFVSSLFTALAVYTDRPLFSALVPMELVGIYAIAWGLANQPVEVILPLGRRVVFPALCRSIEAGKDLRHSVARCKSPMLVGGGWSMACMALLGPALIRVAYDARYEQVQWILPMVAAGAWLRILVSTNSSALMALGKPQSIAYGNIIKVILMIASVPISIYYFGLFGGILAIILTDIPKYIWSVYAASREGIETIVTDLIASGAIVLTAGLGYGVILMLRPQLDGTIHPRAVEAAAAAAAGLTVTALWAYPLLLSWRFVKGQPKGKFRRPKPATENQEN